VPWGDSRGTGDGGRLEGGNIFIAGTLALGNLSSATVNLGCGAHSVVLNKANVFFAKLTPSGSCTGDKVFLSDGEADVSGNVADGANRPIAAFSLSSTTDFGGGTIGGSGARGWAIASFNTAGAFRWARTADASSTAYSVGPAHPSGVAANASRIIVLGLVVGSCATTCSTSPPSTTLVLAGKTLTAVSAQDLFLSSFVP